MAKLPVMQQEATHPLGKWLDDQGVKQNEFAARVKCSESHLALVLGRDRGISLKLALAIERETEGAISTQTMFDHAPKHRAEVAAE